MNLRTLRPGPVLLSVATLAATALPPAPATTVKALEFTGIAHLTGGVGYPGLGPGGTFDPDKIPCTTGAIPDLSCVSIKSGPKGDPEVNFNPEGNHSGFSLNSISCLKISVSTDPTKKIPGPALCTFSAQGVAWGYCGLLTGIGVATINNLGIFYPLKESFSIDIKFTAVAGQLYLTGGNMSTNIYSIMTLDSVPSTPGGPSCITKTASEWLLRGTATYKDIT